MDKLYTTIKTELTDPELEAKIDLEVAAEPPLAEVNTKDLYAAISTTTPEATVQTEPMSPDAKHFSYSVPQRLYVQIVPEKPSILAEERIFVYVPKVTYNAAGIAKFTSEHFTIVNGEVFLKQTYLTQLILSNMIKLDLLLIVTELPLVGIENRIYIVPIDSLQSAGYIWNAATQSWVSIGSIGLNLNNYYTKAQVDDLILTAVNNRNKHIVSATMPTDWTIDDFWYDITG